MRKRAYKSISGFRLICTAVIGLSLGGLLGVILLIITPPVKVAEIPSEETETHKPGQLKVYYQPGIQASSKPSDRFVRSHKLFNMKQPGMLPFLEQDINAFLSQFEAETPSGEEAAAGGMKVGKPNIRVAEEGIVLSVPSIINPGSPQKLDMTTQIHGHFEMGSSGPVLEVDELYLNSFRVPLFGGLIGEKVRSGLLASAMPAETIEAWARIEKIETEPGRLTIVMGTGNL